MTRNPHRLAILNHQELQRLASLLHKDSELWRLLKNWTGCFPVFRQVRPKLKGFGAINWPKGAIPDGLELAKRCGLRAIRMSLRDCFRGEQGILMVLFQLAHDT